MWQEIGIRLSALLYCSIRGKSPPPLNKGQKSIFQKHDFSTFSKSPYYGSFFKMLRK